MKKISVITPINAPPDRCFDLARSVDVHCLSAGGTKEEAVAGRTSGLLEMGEEVTWRGRHFGITQDLTSAITAFDPPHYFQDRMVRGAFRFLEHDHHFVPDGSGGTTMIDELRFAAPFGPLGWIAERLFLARYLTGFLVERNRVVKELAESDMWTTYIND